MGVSIQFSSHFLLISRVLASFSGAMYPRSLHDHTSSYFLMFFSVFGELADYRRKLDGSFFHFFCAFAGSKMRILFSCSRGGI